LAGEGSANRGGPADERPALGAGAEGALVVRGDPRGEPLTVSAGAEDTLVQAAATISGVCIALLAALAAAHGVEAVDLNRGLLRVGKGGLYLSTMLGLGVCGWWAGGTFRKGRESADHVSRSFLWRAFGFFIAICALGVALACFAFANPTDLPMPTPRLPQWLFLLRDRLNETVRLGRLW